MKRFAAALLALVCVAVLATAQDAPKPDWKLPADAKFSAEDVSISRKVETDAGESEFKIAGTLRVPKGDKPESGYPAVLFVSGSGSQTRHGIQHGMDFGTWELLDAIANAGFVVLATDDRGIGGTPVGEEGCVPTAVGYLDLVGDAQAALDFLSARAEVNKQRVFVIGHSEGGLTAPILARDNENVAGVITMAGMGRNLYDVTLQQVEESMATLPETMRKLNMKVQREFQDAVKEGRDPDFDIAGKEAAPNLKKVWKSSVLPVHAWWHDHFNLDVPAIHAAVKCPVFVAQGQADFQVSPDADARQIVKDLMGGHCADVKLKLYDDLDHLFKACAGRPSNFEMYKEARPLSRGYIGVVINWLTEHAE